jgi:cysteine desulfuration protein SufE
LAAILCRGFQGASAPEILDTDPQFVAEIVGGNLVRLRSRTVFYMLGRMKESVQAWLAIPSGAEQRKLRP